MGKRDDSFDLNIGPEEIGTPEAKVCGLKAKAPYKISVIELDLEEWVSNPIPGYVVKIAK